MFVNVTRRVQPPEMEGNTWETHQKTIKHFDMLFFFSKNNFVCQQLNLFHQKTNIILGRLGRLGLKYDYGISI